MVFDTHEFKVGTAYAVLSFCIATVVVLTCLIAHLTYHASKQIKHICIPSQMPNKHLNLLWILCSTIICIIFFELSTLFIVAVVLQYILIDGHKLHDNHYIDHLYCEAFEEMIYMIAICDSLGHLTMISVFISRFKICFASNLFGDSLKLIRVMEKCMIILIVFVIVIIALIISVPSEYITIIILEIIWEISIEILCLWMMYLFITKLYNIFTTTFAENQFHRDMSRAVNPVVEQKKDEQSSRSGGSGSPEKESKGSKGSKNSKKSKNSTDSKGSGSNKFWKKNKSTHVQPRQDSKQTLQMTNGKSVDRFPASPISIGTKSNQSMPHSSNPDATTPNSPISSSPIPNQATQLQTSNSTVTVTHSPDDADVFPNPSIDIDDVPSPKGIESLNVIEEEKIETYHSDHEPEYTITSHQNISNQDAPSPGGTLRSKENKDTSELVVVIAKMTLLIVVVTICSLLSITGNVIVELHEIETIAEHDIDITSMYIFLLPVIDMIVTSFMLYLQFNFATNAYSTICGKLDLFFLTLWMKIVRKKWKQKLKRIGTETYKKKNTEITSTISHSHQSSKNSGDTSITIIYNNNSASRASKQIVIPTITPNKHDWNKNGIKMTVNTKQKTTMKVILH